MTRSSYINLDNIAIAYMIWCIVCVIRTSEMHIGHIVVFNITAIICAFTLARAIKNKAWILGALTSAGIAQATYVILQLWGIAKSNHELFEITGFLGNPGQLGGFQAISFVSTLVLYNQHRSRKWKIMISASATFIFFSLILSDSRAGLLATIVGILTLTYKSWTPKFKIDKWRYLIALCLICLFALLLYLYRPESFNSRIFIWRVCLDMVIEKPLFGFGSGGFNMNYMSYQGEYISSHTTTDYSAIADNVAYPYNEFIHILIEQGLIGLSLFVLMIIIGIRESHNRHLLRAPLVTFLVFSGFSYPSYEIALSIILPLLIGILPTRPLNSSNNIRMITIAVSVTTLVLSLIGISECRQRFHNMVSCSFNNKATIGITEDMESFFIDNYSDLKTNAIYASFAKQFPEALKDKTISRLFPSSDNWCAIGRHYMTLHEYEKAEKYFSQAANMVPGLIQPKYLLWKTYIMQGKDKDARKMAEAISSMQVKVENTYTLRIRNEVINYNRNSQNHLHKK